MRKQRNDKNEKTKVVQKKRRKRRKAGKVEQVIEGGGVQVGTSDRPGRCQPRTLRKKKYSYSKYVYARVPVGEVYSSIMIAFVFRKKKMMFG